VVALFDDYYDILRFIPYLFDFLKINNNNNTNNNNKKL